MKKNIAELISQKPLTFVYGAEKVINKYSLKERDYKGERFENHAQNLTGFYEILNFTKPRLIGEIDERFLKSGVDIILTNTLRANRYYLGQIGLEDTTYELNLTGAKLVRDKITKYSSLSPQKPRYAAGAIGTLPEEISNKEEIQSIYNEQIKGLLAGKVELLFFYDFAKSSTLSCGLSALNEILTKRNKEIDVMIVAQNQDLLDWFISQDLRTKWGKINFISLGISGDYENEKIFETVKSADCSPCLMCEANQDDEKVIETLDSCANEQEPKFVGIDAGLRTTTIEKISNIINSK